MIFIIYLGLVIVGFFMVIVLIFVDKISVDWRCFIGDLLSLEDIEHREANDFSSIELNEDCWSRVGLDDLELLPVVPLLNKKMNR